jgi:membrane protein YdbS with pleckstrin-like domain
MPRKPPVVHIEITPKEIKAQYAVTALLFMVAAIAAGVGFFLWADSHWRNWVPFAVTGPIALALFIRLQIIHWRWWWNHG